MNNTVLNWNYEKHPDIVSHSLGFNSCMLNGGIPQNGGEANLHSKGFLP